MEVRLYQFPVDRVVASGLQFLTDGFWSCSISGGHGWRINLLVRETSRNVVVAARLSASRKTALSDFQAAGF
jgi:hypothetical protein